MRARVGSTIGAGYDLVRSCRSSGRWTALSLLFTLRQGLRRRNLYSHDLSCKQRSILRPIFLFLSFFRYSISFSFSFVSFRFASFVAAKMTDMSYDDYDSLFKQREEEKPVAVQNIIQIRYKYKCI